MTEERIATEFTLCLQALRDYTAKALWHFRSHLELNDVISECYIYVHSARHLISEDTPLEAIAKNWIKQNIIWTNSPIRTRLGVTDAPCLTDTAVYDTIPVEETFHAWYKTLTPYEQSLWNLWHERGLRRGKEVSGYLDISLSSAYLVLKECRQLETRLHTYINNTF